MPSLSIPLTVGNTELEFSVIYSVLDPIPGTHDDPEDPGGVFLEGVRCVAMRIGDGEPMPAEGLEAIQPQAMELFWAEVGNNEARAACARAWDEMLEGARA